MSSAERPPLPVSALVDDEQKRTVQAVGNANWGSPFLISHSQDEALRLAEEMADALGHPVMWGDA